MARIFNVDSSNKYCAEDKVGSLTLMKKLINWDDINFGTVPEEQKEFLKQIWDNPAIFEKEIKD